MYAEVGIGLLIRCTTDINSKSLWIFVSAKIHFTAAGASVEF